ncbi:MAG: hypothetical protein WA919_03905 [Coleofasciculaceae cyanobacterium]
MLLVMLAVSLGACKDTSNLPELKPTNQPREKTAQNKTPTGELPQTANQEKPPPETVASATKGERKGYKPISLTKIEDRTTFIGKKPKEIALLSFGNTDSEKSSEQVAVEYPKANQAIVTITTTDVADDSVNGIRYRVELEKNQSAKTGKNWEIVWAGSQYKCQPGRGHQDWQAEFCQ